LALSNDKISSKLSAKPIYRQARQSDMRIVAHKSAGLAAQNFMISMAVIMILAQWKDLIHRIKKILHLPANTEINMILSCGIRDAQGIYGERFRIPLKVYFKR
jgi:nitroreductase